MIETPNLHKAERARSLDPDENVCVVCNEPIKHLPAGQGWVHEDGHVLGYNEAPKRTFTFTVTAEITGASQQDAWDSWVEWLREPMNIENATIWSTGEASG